MQAGCGGKEIPREPVALHLGDRGQPGQHQESRPISRRAEPGTPATHIYRLTIDFGDVRTAPTDVISGRTSVRRMRSGRSTTKWRPAAARRARVVTRRRPKDGGAARRPIPASPIVFFFVVVIGRNALLPTFHRRIWTTWYLCSLYNYTTRLRFDGRSTACQRSLRSQRRNELASVTLTYLFI